MSSIKKTYPILLRVFKWARRAVFALSLIVVAFYLFQAAHRPARQPMRSELSDGVVYSRHVQDKPQRAVWHVVEFDLSNAAVELFTTPPDRLSASNHLLARTTTQFADEFGADLAINASFFYPIAYNPTNFYPKVGDPVTSVGLTISDGIEFSAEDDDYFHTLCILPRQVVIQFTGCPPKTINAVSGNAILLLDGEPYAEWSNFETWRYSRSIVATDATGKRVWFVIVDGQQPGYSRGLTLAEVADFLVTVGATSAINLDGGGSTTLVSKGTLLNAPVQNLIPMNQRPVANHLGLKVDVQQAE